MSLRFIAKDYENDLRYSQRYQPTFHDFMISSPKPSTALPVNHKITFRKAVKV